MRGPGGGIAYVDEIFCNDEGVQVPGGDGAQKPRSASHDFSRGPEGRDAVAVTQVAPANSTKAQPRFVWQDVPIGTSVAVRLVKAEQGALPWTPYTTARSVFAKAFAGIDEQRRAIASDRGSLAEYKLDVTARFKTANDTANGASQKAAQAVTEVETVANDLIAAGQRIDTLTAITRKGMNLLRNGDGRAGMQGIIASGPGFYATTDAGVGPLFANFSAQAGDYMFWDVAVNAGRNYSISGRMNCTPQRSGIGYVQWLNAARDQVIGPPTTTFTSASWAREGANGLVAPDGAAWARVVVYMGQSGTFLGTQFQLQEGDWSDFDDTADVTETTASVIQQAGVIAAIDGRTEAYLRFQTRAGDSGTEVVFMSKSGQPSLIYFKADQIVFDGKSILFGSTPTVALANNAVTTIGAVTMPNKVQGGAPMTTVLSYTVVMDYPGVIIAWARGQNTYTATPQPSYGAEIWINGSPADYDGAGAGFVQTGFTMIGRRDVGAGTHTVEERWTGASSGIRLEAASLVVMGVKK